MSVIWPYLRQETGRTTDFSYGGLLMWVDMFQYEYCIHADTLFIKGVLEDDRTKPAFSLPVGALTPEEYVGLLRDYCCERGIELEFSAVPEYALPLLEPLHEGIVTPLADWGDYLYDAEALATLAGKKLSKKRNHVNRFMADNPDWSFEPLSDANLAEALAFMDIYDSELDDSPMGRAESALTRRMLGYMACGDPVLAGGLLRTGGRVCAFTIGDVKGDTLYVHIEKATRAIAGSYETINREFAAHMLASHPGLRYINREDDSGDPGLRRAKESYRPVAILRKYNIQL